MNNPNPFIPQGSLLEQRNRKRARVKVAVFSIFALNILVITPLLIQGCQKDKSADSGTPPPPDVASNTAPTTPDTNNGAPALAAPSNSVPTVASNPVPPPPPPPPPPEPTTKEYTVVKGDSFYSIAKKYGVKMKDIQSANPTVVPTKLKAGQKLQIPASAGAATTGGDTTAMGGSEVYTVKPGDTLSKIAKLNGTTIKALRAANGLKTDRIKVNDKLKVPGKAPAADTTTTAPAPPAPAPTPAPTQGSGAAGLTTPTSH